MSMIIIMNMLVTVYKFLLGLSPLYGATSLGQCRRWDGHVISIMINPVPWLALLNLHYHSLSSWTFTSPESPELWKISPIDGRGGPTSFHPYDHKDHRDHKDRKDHKDHKDHRDHKDHKDHRNGSYDDQRMIISHCGNYHHNHHEQHVTGSLLRLLSLRLADCCVSFQKVFWKICSVCKSSWLHMN